MPAVYDIIHAHLQAASAEQRHVYVAGSNYDDNLPHLQYLAAQSDLDQATAKASKASRVRPKRLFINSEEAPCGISGLSW